MNFRTTLLLLVLAVGGGFAYWYFDRPAARPTRTESALSPEPKSITRIEIAKDGKTVDLVRDGNAWSLPGGWPTRRPEVQELVDLLTGLESRFEPIPVSEGEDLTQYGLDKSQKPITVTVTISPPAAAGGSKTLHLLFGEPADRSGNPFTRPTYVRLEGRTEIYRAAPGLLLTLNRPQDDYRKRQLFSEAERVRVGDPRPTFPGEPEMPQPAVALLDAKRVNVTGPDGAWALTSRGHAPRKPGTELPPDRLAEEWELAEPVADHADPDKLRAALAVAPDIWVDNFVTVPNLADAGLDKPERTLKVETATRTIDLLIGKISREVEKKAPPPPANPFGAPPPPPPGKEVYRYAKLAGNPQVFEIKADKLGDLFVSAAGLRDPRLVRFKTADARRVEIVRPDGQIVLADERDEAAKEDHWKLVQESTADADALKVTELLDRLAELRANGPDVIDKADPKMYALDPAENKERLMVELSEPVPGGDEKARAKRTIALWIGRRDADKNKVYVQVDGNPRVNAVGDDFLKLVERPALAYRSRRVIDVTAKQIAAVTVQRAGEQYKLEQTNGTWKLAEPVKSNADAGKAATLINDLSRLEVGEFVNDKPTSEELAKYGLTTPPLAATLTFADPTQPAKTLQLGNARQGKPEIYAKWAAAPGVFTVPEAVKAAIDQPSLAYRPLQLWQIAPEAVTAIEVQNGGDKYRLSLEGGGWKLTGPFDAPASGQSAAALLTQLATLRAERYESHTTADAAKYGLDKPSLRLTVFAKDAEPRGLVIGNPAAADVKSRFAKPSDSDAVVVVPAGLIASAERPPLDLIEPELVSLNANLITAARGAGPEGNWELKRDGEWKIVSPNSPAVADRVAVQNALRPWAELRAERFAAYGAKIEWAKFGLDKPAATVSVTVLPLTGGAAETHSLALGKAVEGTDGRYARFDERPGVAVLSAAMVRELTHAPLDFADRTLFAFDPVELIAIRRSGPAGELELVKKDEGWQVTKPAADRPDQPALEELAERLAGLRADKVAELNPGDLKTFGLDTPTVVTLVLKGKDGKQSEKVLRVGTDAKGKDVAPGGSGEHYAQLDGQSAVFVLPAAVSKLLVGEPLKFRDRAVARLSGVDRIVVERGPRRVTFAKADGPWKMTEPLSAEAEATDLGDLVGTVSRLRADELVAEKPDDLKQFGLDQPESRWRFFSGEREEMNLLIGRRDPASGRSYAKLASGDLVFFLSPDLSNRLLAEYRKRTLWTGLDAAATETLVYAVGDQTLVLQKINDSWQVPARPDQAVDTTAVNDVLAALAGLKVDRYVVDKGADFKQYGLQPPERAVVARTRTGVTATIYLGKTEDGSKQLYARSFDPNRTDVFLLSEADSTRLIKDLKSFTK
jgi:hypothetical protein